ncbi:hypothetical protein H4R18_003041 [Coemansia javaensis]|uniref:Phospholipase/lecithinase/hemolysin n=1 Tax=Coemansia javaensis TaxID=2761396 RepID=A0A9W8LGW9_9FUNG|nr:hypothetical protein H4R18_003041 [Coemansia javaensis]
MLVLTVLAAVALGGAGVCAGRTVYVFGDSLSDTGRMKRVTLGLIPSDLSWEGRFSNGPVWCEYTALLQNATLQDHAVGAATAASTFSMSLGRFPVAVPSARDQLDEVRAQTPLDPMPERGNDVAVLMVGSNNFLDAAAGLKTGEEAGTAAVDRFAEQLADAVAALARELRAMGFASIVVAGMPPLHLVPAVRAWNASAVAQRVAEAYNPLLARRLGAWAAAARVPAFAVLDLYALMQAAMDPSVGGALGVADTADPCVTNTFVDAAAEGTFLELAYKLLTDPKGGSVCARPETRFFWDIFHPTDRLHRLFGYYASELIDAAAAAAGAGVPLPRPAPDTLLKLIDRYGLAGPVARPARI